MSDTGKQAFTIDAPSNEHAAEKVLQNPTACQAITDSLEKSGVRVLDRSNLSEDEKVQIYQCLTSDPNLLPHFEDAARAIGFKFTALHMEHFALMLLCKMEFRKLLPKVQTSPARTSPRPPPPPIPECKVIIEDDEEDEPVATQPPTDTTTVDHTPLPAPAPPPAPENPPRSTPEQMRATALMTTPPLRSTISRWEIFKNTIGEWASRVKFAAIWLAGVIVGFGRTIYRFGKRIALAGYGRVKAWRLSRAQKKVATPVQPKQVQPPPTPLDAAKTGVHQAPQPTTTEPAAPTETAPTATSHGRSWAFAAFMVLLLAGAGYAVVHYQPQIRQVLAYYIGTVPTEQAEKPPARSTTVDPIAAKAMEIKSNRQKQLEAAAKPEAAPAPTAPVVTELPRTKSGENLLNQASRVVDEYLKPEDPAPPPPAPRPVFAPAASPPLVRTAPTVAWRTAPPCSYYRYHYCPDKMHDLGYRDEAQIRVMCYTLTSHGECSE